MATDATDTDLGSAIDHLLSRLTERTPEQIEAMETEQRQREQDRERARRLALLDTFIAAVGERYRHCTARTFDVSHEAQREALAILRAYAASMAENIAGGVNLILYGPPGTGKDHLAVSLARHAILAGGVEVAFVTGMDLYARLRHAMDSICESEDTVLLRLEASPILLLSDPLPPSGTLTEYQSTALYRLVDARYRQLRPTWATINVQGGNEATRRLGSPIYDRLRDNAAAICCNWQSHRRPRA